MNNIDINNLANEVGKILNTYTNDVVEEVNNTIDDLASTGADTLKNTTYPSATDSGTAKAQTRRVWKEYAKGWKKKRVKEQDNSISVVIYNSKKPHLTHLLEYGHATKDGNRTRAFKHIGLVEEQIEKQLDKELAKAIDKANNK